MRTFPVLLSAALVLSFACSGCIEIFCDVVQNPDGTYIVRERAGLSMEMFRWIASLDRSITPDSTHMSDEMLMDSLKRAFARSGDTSLQIDSLLGRYGITAVRTNDTTIDSTFYITREADVSNIDSLPAAFAALQKFSKSKPSGDGMNENPLALQDDVDTIALQLKSRGAVA